MKRTVFLAYEHAVEMGDMRDTEVVLLVPEEAGDIALPAWASRSVPVPFKDGMPLLSHADLALASGAMIAFADGPAQLHGDLTADDADILVTDWWSSRGDFLPERRERSRLKPDACGRHAITSEADWLAHLRDGGDPAWLLFNKPICWAKKSWLLEAAAGDERMAPGVWLQGCIRQTLQQGQPLNLRYLDAAPVSIPHALALPENERLPSLQKEMQAWAALLSFVQPETQSLLLGALAFHRPWLLSERAPAVHPVAGLSSTFRALQPKAQALRTVLKEAAAWLVVEEAQFDTIQVHSRQSAAAWGRDQANLTIVAMRSEVVRIDRFLIIECHDASFEGTNGKFFQLMALYRQPDGRWVLPALVKDWSSNNLDALAAKLSDSAASLQRNQITIAPALQQQLSALGDGRFLPGLESYATLVQHTARYRWAASHAKLGKVLDCASGAGYGWHILDDVGTMSAYTGIDLDYGAIDFARRFLRDQVTDSSIVKLALSKFFKPADDRCRFEARLLDSLPKAAFDTVISFETIEHTEDPEVFLWDLAERIAPGGRLLLSLPTERWAGTHLNPAHWTNWTEARLRRLCERVFAKVRLLRLRLSLVTPETFQSALFHEAGAEAGEDEGFLLVLENPRPRQLMPRVVVQRRFAMGDALLATSLIPALKKKYPDHQLVIKTAVVEAFQALDEIDIVGSMDIAVRTEDVFIDLDGSYEAQRGLHIVDAYANTAGVEAGPVAMALMEQDYRKVVGKILDARWLQDTPPPHLVALHLQASSPFRIWPLAYWVELIEKLSAQGAAIILLGGGKDGGSDNLPETLRTKVLSLVREARLHETAAAIAVADFLIAPDSGLTHIASAVGTPVIGLYGMVEPALRLPKEGKSIGLIADIECKGCLATLPPEALPLCHRGHAYCMDELKVDPVWQACQQMLRDLPGEAWCERLAAATTIRPVRRNGPS